jgi:hypothetical protein
MLFVFLIDETGIDDINENHVAYEVTSSYACEYAKSLHVFLLIHGMRACSHNSLQMHAGLCRQAYMYARVYCRWPWRRYGMRWSTRRYSSVFSSVRDCMRVCVPTLLGG